MTRSSTHQPSRPLIDPIVVAAGAVVLALDQITKAIVTQALGPGAPQHSIQVVGDYFRLVYSTNTGAAFGMFPQGTGFFALVALVAVPILLFGPRLLSLDGIVPRICLGMLLGGALGNLTDRIRLGYVVDFVDWGIGQTRWYTFNVADSAFVVGVAILALYTLFWASDGEGETARGEGVGAEDARAGEGADRPLAP